MSTGILSWLQDWYLSNCDGDWEHEYGVSIETLDNPGWRVTIDLAGTAHEQLQASHEEHRTENDWIVYRVRDWQLQGACGPSNLAELLERFQSVLSTPSTEGTL